jgi:hypothetical protein
MPECGEMSGSYQVFEVVVEELTTDGHTWESKTAVGDDATTNYRR